MKKIVLFLMVTLLTMICLPVFAEGVALEPARFDWTPVVTVAIRSVSAIAAAFLVYWLEKHVKPWLEEKGLSEAAKRAVYTAEAFFGRFCGEKKWEMALEIMKEKGFSIDTNRVLDALKAAWKELDLNQMLAGEKTELMVELADESIKPPEN